MNRIFTGIALLIATLLQLSALAYGGPLDDYYLQQFGEANSAQLQKAVLSVTADVQGAAQCGMPIKKGLRRDWNLLEASTQKVLAKQLALPALSGTPTSLTSSGGHFIIHYTTSGLDAPNIYDYTVDGVLYHGINYYTGLNLTSAADWATIVGNAFETAYTFYQNLGYHMPPTDPYDVYLGSLADKKEYGETTDISKTPSSGFPYASSSFIEIDKDFTNSIFHPTTYTPLQSLQITSAHEFHHAIQYGYNYYFDIWYAEATSTWFEDEVYPTVNQNYSYIAAWFQNSTRQLDLAVDSSAVSTGAGYGRWIFNRYMAENHTTTVVRSFWEALAPIAPTNGQDIPMAPVLDSVLSISYNGTLSTDFFGFTKRVYTRDWQTHSNEKYLIPPYSPITSFSVDPLNGTEMTPSITLNHYSFAYYKFSPSSGVTSLSISVNKGSGIQTALFKNGSEINADASGTSYVTNGLGTSDEVVLLIANTTSTDGQSASFSSDGKLVVLSSVPTTTTSKSGGGGGCFIATAAYGSYLHPQVQLLRNFRDKYLLTNAPGRAFVALYYRLSPPLADVIARHAVLRGITRLALTPIIFAVVYPLISAVSLFLFIGGAMVFRLRRKKNARSHAHSYSIHATSSRF
ncbi:MAG: hypothetical protein PHR66_13145 [Desulfuromonadaceae bacterium]|nr:hypothetical protein [Desulfuromonadaceae bacterium]